MSRRPATFLALAAGVVASGIGLLARVLLTADHSALQQAVHSSYFWAFAAFLVPAELWPVRAPIVDGSREELTTSPAFAFALLLVAGLAPALAALAGAMVLAAVVRRRSLAWIVFDMASTTLALGGAVGVLSVFGHVAATAHGFAVSADTIGAVLAAGAVLFVVTNFLGGLAPALQNSVPAFRYLTREFTFQASMVGVLIALIPVAVVAARSTLVVAPLMAFPLLSVYRSATSSLARERDALHDALTGLPNRTLLLDRLEQATARCRRNGGVLAVLLIDLDGFKEVNDTLGHHMGDVLLQRVATRLQHHLREVDTVSRLGGDEFAVFLPDLGSLDTARDTARRLLGALAEPFNLENISLGVQASIGIAGFPEHGLDTATLLQRADMAMYQAKAVKSGVELYVETRDRSSRRRLTLTGELRGALEDDQLVLHYQPKARLSDGEVTSVEALVRWNHPWYGLVAPGEFIPLAERTGMMRPLTIKVLDQALSQWRRWTDLGVDLGVAVNISTQNFHDLQLPDEIESLLRRYRVPARSLEIEITESMLIADPLRAMHILSRLSEMGVRLAIDDFGTGYSSLAYLKRLPVTGLKIDRSFVLHLPDDENDAMIVRSTIDLARNLGLETVAEGVETEASFLALRELGCDFAQGFFLSEALPGDELLAWLRARRRSGGKPTAAPCPPVRAWGAPAR